MKKAAMHLCALLRNLLFIGFSIQIALGLLWLCFNFMEVQAFGPAEGFLYPILVRMLGRVPQVLYLLQLFAAGAAGYYLLKPVVSSGLFWRIWSVLAFLTFPMALQCHLALLPYSFISSLILLEICFCRNLFRQRQGRPVRELAWAGACWVALSLFKPEYVWLGAIPLGLTVLASVPALSRSRRQLAFCLLLLAAFGGIATGLRSLTAERVKEEQRPFWFAMASRTAWPSLWEDQSQWSEELHALLDNVVWDTAVSPDNMERILKPAIEDEVGVEQAQEYYRELSEIGWRRHKSQILKQMAWDVLTYGTPEAVLQLQLSGRAYDSCSGRNYEIMFMHHPLLTKYYVDYSCWWFFVAVGSAALTAVAGCTAGARRVSLPKAVFLAVNVAAMGGIVLYYTLQGAGIADYKLTVAAAQLWILFALWGMGKEL